MSFKPNTIIFGPFETQKTAFLTAYILNFDEDITYYALPYTKLEKEETQKTTLELVGFKDIENKKVYWLVLKILKIKKVYWLVLKILKI